MSMEPFDIRQAVLDLQGEMNREREYLHMHPERSCEEDKTCAYIREQLEAMGLTVHEVERGGVIGVLDGTTDAPAIILRADVDALPIQESDFNLAGKRSCKSLVPGVMHACGHDAHMAMLLCAARILSRYKPDVPILFVFERAEENNTGILTMLPYLNSHFNIGACYATHVMWNIPTGQVGICRGNATSGALGFEIELRGKGGHGSRPDLASSPIDCFAALHTRLNMLRMTAIEPDQVLTYSLGTVHAGEVRNVIPDTLRFSGTVRTFDTVHAGECFSAALQQVVKDTAAEYGCEAKYLHFPKMVLEATNDEAYRLRLMAAIREQLPWVEAREVKPWMASETMFAYLKWWPGVISFTGIRNEQKGSGAGHHTANFDIDEDGMLYGAAVAVLAALDWCRHPVPVPDGFRTESLESLLERRL